jgi:hypothetical protein
MAPKLTIKKDYILVEPQRNEYWEIWETIGRLIKMPEYQDKNDIWVFHEGPIDIVYDDLYKLRDFIEKNYPENATRSKTAMVVALGLHASLAESFALIAKDLPYEIKVFFDLQSAEDWITE